MTEDELKELDERLANIRQYVIDMTELGIPWKIAYKEIMKVVTNHLS